MDALNALIEKHPRWGFWKCFGRLRNTGHAWNHKRVHRVYKAMKLNLPRRIKRRLPTRVQQPMVVEARANAEWSMDFMSDTLYRGRRFRTLNILDEGVREALDIVVDTSTREAALSARWIVWSSGGAGLRRSGSTRDMSSSQSFTGAPKIRASSTDTSSRQALT